jgi:hypothetical protein
MMMRNLIKVSLEILLLLRIFFFCLVAGKIYIPILCNMYPIEFAVELCK